MLINGPREVSMPPLLLLSSPLAEETAFLRCSSHGSSSVATTVAAVYSFAPSAVVKFVRVRTCESYQECVCRTCARMCVCVVCTPICASCA